MVRRFSFLLATMASLSLVACGTYPKSRVEQGAAPTGLYFTAPVSAHAWVDGSDIGEAAAHAGINTFLPVAPGLRHVTIRLGEAVLLDQQIYVGSGSRILVRAQ
jgi:hypothetical protein